MVKRRIRALLIEADSKDALRLLGLAHRAEYVEIDIEWKRSPGDAGGAAIRSRDVVLIGLEGGEESALEVVAELQGSTSPAPILVLARSSSRSAALRLIRRGVENHLDKERLTAARLERALQFAMERQRAKTALRAAEAEYRGLFENVIEGVYRSSPDGKLLTANPSLVRMLGYESMEELLEIDLRDLYVNPHDREKWLDRLESRDEIRNSEALLRRKNGESVTVLETSRAVRSESGETLYCEGSLLDITERKQYERHLEYLVNHDSLTGLLSRRRFLQELNREVERAKRYATHGSLLLIDLDDFKEINDTCGHQIGDDVLTAVGRVLTNRLRQTDIVARLGGDEFAVLAPQTAVIEAQTVAAAVLDTLWNGTVRTDGQRHRVGASIGIALIDEECSNAEAVLNRADQAMYLAKSKGGRDCEVYSPTTKRPTIGLKAG